MKPGKTPSITIVGGMTLDLALWLPELPAAGTIGRAERGEFFSGGKGFSQAVCARRCGANVTMVGVLGNDPFASIFLDTFENEGIDSSHVFRAPVGTSLTFPMFHPNGEHALIGLSRSNRYLQPEDILHAKSAIKDADAALIQLEIPLETALQAIRLAGKFQRTVFVNPSPVREDFKPYLTGEKKVDNTPLQLDWLILNQDEAEKILNRTLSSIEEALKYGAGLLYPAVRKGVVITMGEKGAVLISPEISLYQPAFPTRTVYPIGAGDAFAAAFAVRIIQQDPLEQSLRFAAAAGALAAARFGGADSQPSFSEVQHLLAAYPDLNPQ
ncbi:MAG: hypothetical protein JXA25_14510 [Anaerolineales bacterium]|nr:hypothetical protein [Anaerolineales bacterium]